jgi:hypothetical protein
LEGIFSTVVSQSPQTEVLQKSMRKETERNLWQKTPKQLDDGISKPKKKSFAAKIINL